MIIYKYYINNKTKTKSNDSFCLFIIITIFQFG